MQLLAPKKPHTDSYARGSFVMNLIQEIDEIPTLTKLRA